MTGQTNDQAVSVIVGTLLLILITVTAAAGLAVMISQMQKDEMNRQTHLAAVKNENITILNVAFENNQTEWVDVPNAKNWSSVKVTLLNMNIDDVTVMGIAINDQYALNFTDRSRTDPDVSTRTIYNSTNYLRIPATKSQDIYIDFVANASDDPSGFIDYRRAQNFDVGSLQTIKVITSLTNFFEKSVKAPNPVPQIQMETDNLGSLTRDALVLDSSQSTTDGTLVSSSWTIYDASFTVPPGNWTDSVNWTSHFRTFPGKTVRLNNQLNNTAYYRATLTVKDSNGLTATSDPISIPLGNFNPPTSLQLAFSPNSTPQGPETMSLVSATLYDVNNNPVPGVPVIFIVDNNPNTPQSCFSVDKMANVTDNKGSTLAFITQRNTTSPYTPLCPQPVTMHAESGKLLSPTILIPGISTF